jgi:hypothetical protein
MQAERYKRFHGYVKVEVQGRAPRRWAWAIHRSDSETIVLRDNAGFAYADDAWKAGQSALRALEAGEDATPLAA